MIISLKNMTAGLVPAILTVSSNSLLSMGLFSTSTKMALISSTVCMEITFVRDFRTAVVCLDPKFWTSLRASATRGNFSVGPEHVVGGIHGLLSEVVLLLLEAADLPPLLAGDSLGVFKQEVLHVPRCGNVWQSGLSLAHLLECQNLAGAGHSHLSVDTVAPSNQTVLVAPGGDEETPLGALGDVPGPHHLEDLLALAHLRLHQSLLSLADEVGGNLSDLVGVLTNTVNSLLHHGPEGGQVAVGHGMGAWDLVGELHGGWQLDLDGSNQGLLEVDAPLWLVG